MQLEDWAEFIKNVLSPTAFKTVAVEALRALYQRPVVLTDGTGDGGVDAWVVLASEPPLRVPVQFYVGRAVAWDQKLAEDIEKPEVKNNPSKRLFFVCAQTPTAEKVRRKVAEIEGSHGIAVTVFDARAIASFVHDSGVADALARVAPVRPSVVPSARTDAVGDTQVAFIFFHEASGNFRAEIARSALMACLVPRGIPVPTEDLLRAAQAVVGATISRGGLFRKELKALISEGKVRRDAGQGVLATEASERLALAMVGARDEAARKLYDDCVMALEGRVHSDALRRQAVSDVFNDLGLLLRRSLIDRLPGGKTDGLAARLNAVERRLADLLKPGGGTATEAIKALVSVAEKSVYGHALASTELFVHLTGRETSELPAALTGRSRLEVMLDTSVAMPMLCAKLDRVALGWVTSELCLELHGLLSDRGIAISVPHLYVEEIAAHIVEAARRYSAVVGEDSDLVRSENFFVAHYHSVCAGEGETATSVGFEELLYDLGLPEDWASADFYLVRRRIEKALKLHLERYGIEVGRVPYIEALPLNNEPSRPAVVLGHDRCVARWLEDRAQDTACGLVLCSQDRWLTQAMLGTECLAVDPAALIDLVQIVQPGEGVYSLTSLRELTVKLDEAALQRAAAVWDVLAELEGSRLADRALLRRAKQFKAAWLARTQSSDRPHAAEWQRFKAGLALEG